MLQAQIQEDLKEAMLKKDENVKSILRVLIGEFSRVTTNADKTVSDAEVVAQVKKMIENAKLLKNDGEIAILEKYMPQQLTESELKIAIDAIAKQHAYTIKDMGKIMGELKEKYSGQYDGKLASSLVKIVLT